MMTFQSRGASESVSAQSVGMVHGRHPPSREQDGGKRCGTPKTTRGLSSAIESAIQLERTPVTHVVFT